MILMSYKDKLSDYEANIFKGLDDASKERLGIGTNKKGELVQKNPSFKGDTFDEFMGKAGAERMIYSKARPGGPIKASEFYGGGGQSQYLDSLDPDTRDSLIYKDPKRARMARTLERAGITPDHFVSLARDAGIKNVNSKSDMKQIIEQSLLAKAIADEPELAPEPEPEPAPVTTAQDYVLSPTLQSALDFEKSYEEGLATGALNPFRDGYRDAADEVAQSFLSNYSNDLLDLSQRRMTA